MSELIQKYDGDTIRWKLLTSVSTLVLMACVYRHPAQAEDSTRPTVWIELGGQLNRLQDNQEAFAPPFVALAPLGFAPPEVAERPPLYGMDVTGKVSFQPDNSNWVFSASVRYGRASTSKHIRHQSYPDRIVMVNKAYGTHYGVYYHHTGTQAVYPFAGRFTDASAGETERHAIVDFHAGKDLGLGLFGHDTSSFLNVGVRIAQFTSKSQATLGENPDWQFKTHLRTFHFSAHFSGYDYDRHIIQQHAYQPYHSFVGAFRADRSFTGVGPSISWNSTATIAGSSKQSELSLDWGVNAALLFGRQKAKTHHQTTGRFHASYAAHLTTVYQHSATPDHTRSRSVVVPNVGAFAGLSFKYAAAKVSVGYRADFFFGAMDGGIDTQKSFDRNFYGPFASIGIGLGG